MWLYLALSVAIPSIGIALWQLTMSCKSKVSRWWNNPDECNNECFGIRDEEDIEILRDYSLCCSECEANIYPVAQSIFEVEVEEYHEKRKSDLFYIADLYYVEDDNDGGRLRRRKRERRPYANDYDPFGDFTNADGKYDNLSCRLKSYWYHTSPWLLGLILACLPLALKEYLFIGLVLWRAYCAFWDVQWIKVDDYYSYKNKGQVKNNNQPFHFSMQCLGASEDGSQTLYKCLLDVSLVLLDLLWRKDSRMA